jgi:hypothetical protein
MFRIEACPGLQGGVQYAVEPEQGDEPEDA